MVGSLTRSVCPAWAGNAFIVSSRQSSTNEGGYSGSRGYNPAKSCCSLGLPVPTGEAGGRSQPGTAGTGNKGRILYDYVSRQLENSNYWDVQLPESQGDGEAVASDASRPRPASAERLPAKPEPLALDAGARLVLLGISVRYIKTPAEALQVVDSLVDEPGHFGLDVETAKLIPSAHLSQAGLNPHLSRIRLLQVYAGGPEAFVFDFLDVPSAILRPLLNKHFVAHNAIFEFQHMMHAGLEPQKVDCTMLQAAALTGKRPSLSALVE